MDRMVSFTISENDAKAIAEMLVDVAVELNYGHDVALLMLDVLKRNGIDNAAELCRERISIVADYNRYSA